MLDTKIALHVVIHGSGVFINTLPVLHDKGIQCLFMSEVLFSFMQHRLYVLRYAVARLPVVGSLMMMMMMMMMDYINVRPKADV